METRVQELERRLAGFDDDASGSREEIDALNRLGWALVPVDHRRATQLFDRALALSEQFSYPLGAARATFGSGFFDFFTANYGGALTKAHQCAPILRDHGEPRDWANVLLLEGVVHWSLGDFELAMDTLHRGYTFSQGCDYAYGDGWCLTSLGSIYAELGDFDKAVDLQRRSIERFRDADSLVGEGRATSGLGMVLLRQSKLDEARAVLEHSLELNRAGGSELSAARALNDMGLVYEALGEHDRAEACLEESLAIRERYQNWPAVVTTLLALGKVYNDSARGELAAAPLRRAVELSERIATRPKLWQAHAGLSRSYELRGAYREAFEHQRLAQSIKEEVQGEETSTRLKNLQIKHEVETAEKEAELQRLTNVELAGALDRLKQAQSRLVQSEKLAAIGNLVAGVAHELNNPVAALSCGMDVQMRATARIREFLEENDHDGSLARVLDALTTGAQSAALACERIAKLVKSLQCFSQLDKSEFQRVDVNVGFEATIDLARAQRADGVTWVNRLGPTPEIECYPGSLNQALMSLLINAVESIDGVGTVTVTTETTGDCVRLSVEDTGRGLSEERLESLFEIGFNEKDERVQMSTGLANVRATVDRHGGQISVSSVPGEGTCFTIVLPVRQAS